MFQLYIEQRSILNTDPELIRHFKLVHPAATILQNTLAVTFLHKVNIRIFSKGIFVHVLTMQNYTAVVDDKILILQLLFQENPHFTLETFYIVLISNSDRRNSSKCNVNHIQKSWIIIDI